MYWLIITIITTYGAAEGVIPHTYVDKASCEKAGKEATESEDGFLTRIGYMCVPS